MCWNLRIASGPRYTDFITQWPSAFTAAASFDRGLIYERAQRIGQEFRGKGINVALAPVSCISDLKSELTVGNGRSVGSVVRNRSPLLYQAHDSPYAGRNWEGEPSDAWHILTGSVLTRSIPLFDLFVSHSKRHAGIGIDHLRKTLYPV